MLTPNAPVIVPNAPVIVLNTSLVQQSVVDNYESLYFTRGFNAPGTFELKINWNITDDAGFRYASYFQRGLFILVGDNYKKIGIIQEVSKEIGQEGKGSQFVYVRGREASSILSRRIVIPPAGSANYILTGVAETVMKTIVTTQASPTATVVNRRIPILNVITTAGLGAVYTYSSRYKNLQEDLTTISLATAIGWRLVLNPSTLKLDFDCYSGVNRTASQSTNPRVIISTDFDTLRSGKLVDSEVIYKNIVYAAGQGAGENRNVRTVYDTTEPTGIERREVFVDMRDLSTNTDIDSRGGSVIKENQTTKFVDANALVYTQYQIGVDYDLGDYITLSVYDESQDVQITSIKESWSNGNYQTEFSFNRSYPEFPAQIRSSNAQLTQTLNNTELIQSGSNANGNWIKFPDGTLEQWGAYIDPTTTWSGGPWSISPYYKLLTINYPIEFITGNGVIVSPNVLEVPAVSFPWAGYIFTGSATSFRQHIFNSVNSGSTNILLWRAIGKWK